MNSEQDAKLRQLLRQSRELPEPSWNLFSRVSKRFSRLADPRVGIERQAKEAQDVSQREEQEKRQVQQQKEKDEKKRADLEKRELEKTVAQKAKQRMKEKKNATKDIERQNTRLAKMKNIPQILRQAEILRTMNTNFESGIY